ncbi:putative HhH-GDP family base excision DNA repair protein [Cryptosporidium serpentis]
MDVRHLHFHILVSTLLSSQTKDESTAACMNRLKKHGLTPQIICEMSIDSLAKILYGVGFHNNKAKYLKEVSKIIIESYSGKVPDKYEQLISLPGIGPKMANLILQTAFNKVNGISVDTHMHRIFNRIGWVKTKSPNETKYQMEKSLPHSYWRLVNKIFVGFGQIICRPVNPKCNECVIRALCSHGRRRHKTDIIEVKYE